MASSAIPWFPILEVLGVAAVSCKREPSSWAWDGCGKARAIQLWWVTCCSWTQQGVGTDLLPAVTLWKWLLVFLPYGLDPVSAGNRKTNFPFSVSSHLLSSIDVAKLLAPANDARCLRLVCLILGNDSNKGTFSSPLLNSLAPPSGAFSTSTSTSPHFFLRSSSQWCQKKEKYVICRKIQTIDIAANFSSDSFSGSCCES